MLESCSNSVGRGKDGVQEPWGSARRGDHRSGCLDDVALDRHSFEIGSPGIAAPAKFSTHCAALYLGIVTKTTLYVKSSYWTLPSGWRGVSPHPGSPCPKFAMVSLIEMYSACERLGWDER